MADQEIERGPVEGPGGATQLPYGEATQINELQDATPPPAEAETPEAPPAEAPSAPPVEGLPAGGEEEPFTPGAGSTGLNPEDEKWLFSPTERPNEYPTTMRFIDPSDVEDWLPDLATEVARPDTPPQLKAIFKAATLGPEA